MGQIKNLKLTDQTLKIKTTLRDSYKEISQRRYTP